jgi:hypothetical protein
MRCSGLRAAHSRPRLRISIGSQKAARRRNSSQAASRVAARASAAATTNRFAISSERSITPRLQKLGSRMPEPV